jgi:uncharacterized FlgJ-related protein
MAVIAIILINILSANEIDGNKKINNSETLTMNNYVLASSISNERLLNQTKVNNELLAVYDGMTMEELATKLEKNLKSTLKGYGTVFAEYSIKYEVDPYLSLAIVLHETGCYSGKCSTLASKCNNIGGMKGSPGCGGGAYKKFSSLEDGIEAFYKNLSKNYYKKGLTTPETIGKKYAESESWPTRIKYYMNIIEKS